MGLLSRGATWLGTKLLDQASESVTYTRGANSVTVDAVIGGRRVREGSPNDARVVMTGESMDFQFDPAALILNSVVITPARGDQITWSGRVYDVKPRDGEKEWVPSDPFEDLITVHTVRSS